MSELRLGVQGSSRQHSRLGNVAMQSLTKSCRGECSKAILKNVVTQTYRISIDAHRKHTQITSLVCRHPVPSFAACVLGLQRSIAQQRSWEHPASSSSY